MGGRRPINRYTAYDKYLVTNKYYTNSYISIVDAINDLRSYIPDGSDKLTIDDCALAYKLRGQTYQPSEKDLAFKFYNNKIYYTTGLVTDWSSNLLKTYQIEYKGTIYKVNALSLEKAKKMFREYINSEEYIANKKKFGIVETEDQEKSISKEE